MLWAEQHVAGPFDLASAPFAEGLFLGDYQALAAIGDAFVPFFVTTNPASPANRTDVIVSFISDASVASAARAHSAATARASSVGVTAALAERVRASVARTIARRYNQRATVSPGPGD